MAPLQKAMILRVSTHVPKTLNRDADAMEALLATEIAGGWRVVGGYPFSGTDSTGSVLLVILERS